MPSLPTVRLPRPLAQVQAPQNAGEPPRDQTPSLEAQRGELQSAIDAMRGAMAQLPSLQASLVRQAEGQLVELALDIARKVLMQEIRAGRHEIDPIVREALASVPDRQEVVVRLNPQDLARCGLARNGDDGADPGVRFVADPTVQPAQCIIETPGGTVESDVESHLGRIAEALKGEV